ncbi:hypothetical protein VHEMI10520 [[Torrubiella] hemipterigena]|uniref:Aminoglycoside phosphotransferase domain-containing protein n=1 Tax=[Torrubiella] hemipterigena TaxID=1531966 RepID=A0A0A1TTF1_9HYPO|nr:hypothetical protein VHEMI10520 [[Torrubiella] hemipterigena]
MPSWRSIQLKTLGAYSHHRRQQASQKPVQHFSITTQVGLQCQALIEHQVGLIRTGEIAPSAPIDQYLVYKSLLDNLPRKDDGSYFLRHIDSRDASFLVDSEYNITGIIDWELAIVTAKEAAFQSRLLLYNLGELYNEGISTLSEDEKRFSKILQEETQSGELSALAAQKLHFRIDQVIETSPEDRENFTKVFSGWWKAATGEETFDWDIWYQNALKKYGNGGFTHSLTK